MNGNGYELSEIGSRTWRIATIFGGRHLFQYVLASEQGSAMVIDSGTADTPRHAILPALEKIGIRRSDVIVVLITHPDLDHQGGLAALKDAIPGAAAACGFGDPGLVADPERLISERCGAYEHAHGMGYDKADKDTMRALSGRPVWIDLPLAGVRSSWLASGGSGSSMPLAQRQASDRPRTVERHATHLGRRPRQGDSGRRGLACIAADLRGCRGLPGHHRVGRCAGSVHTSLGSLAGEGRSSDLRFAYREPRVRVGCR